jgi:hypothetical protein
VVERRIGDIGERGDIRRCFVRRHFVEQQLSRRLAKGFEFVESLPKSKVLILHFVI